MLILVYLKISVCFFRQVCTIFRNISHYTILGKETTGNSLPSKWIIKKKQEIEKKTFRAKVKLILKRGYNIYEFFLQHGCKKIFRAGQYYDQVQLLYRQVGIFMQGPDHLLSFLICVQICRKKFQFSLWIERNQKSSRPFFDNVHQGLIMGVDDQAHIQVCTQFIERYQGRVGSTLKQE